MQPPQLEHENLDSNEPSPLVSVVVVNWNGMPYLEECLESIQRQTYSPRELCVVDNGSVDGSRQWLAECDAKKFNLLLLERNMGFAAGVNAGIRASRGSLVALLNNDAVADPSWLTNLVTALREPDVGMVASKILFYERHDTIDKAGHYMYPDGLNRGRGAGEIDRGQYDVPGEILFPDGCAALYRKSVLLEVGLFDEQFFAYGDDADLGLRARWRGWRCIYSPTAKVYHRHSRSLGKYSPRKAFLVERNRFWVAVKLFPLPLLLASPAFTLWRFGWHIWSMLTRRGLAGGVLREHSALGLLGALLQAYVSGLAGLGLILKKRRDVFAGRRIDSRSFSRLLRQYRISARELALRD